MTNKIGIWIDHRKAVIVTVLDDGEQVDTISSNVEKHPERAGDSPLKGRYEAQQVPADDKRQRALTGNINAALRHRHRKDRNRGRDVHLRPRRSQGELKRRLEHQRLGSRVSALETADKLTDRQIRAKVRLHFSAT